MDRGSQWAWDHPPINSGGTEMSKALGCNPANIGVIRRYSLLPGAWPSTSLAHWSFAQRASGYERGYWQL